MTNVTAIHASSSERATSPVTGPIGTRRHEELTAASDLDILPSLSMIQGNLKEVIEAYIAEAYFNQVLRAPLREDNPFDEIYISALLPDRIHEPDMGEITRFVDIVDLSEGLDFDDALAD